MEALAGTQLIFIGSGEDANIFSESKEQNQAGSSPNSVQTNTNNNRGCASNPVKLSTWNDARCWGVSTAERYYQGPKC